MCPQPLHIAKYCRSGLAVSVLEDLKARIAAVDEENDDDMR